VPITGYTYNRHTCLPGNIDVVLNNRLHAVRWIPFCREQNHKTQNMV